MNRTHCPRCRRRSCLRDGTCERRVRNRFGRLCEGEGHPGGPASEKECAVCHKTKPNTTFRRGGNTCTACENAALRPPPIEAPAIRNGHSGSEIPSLDPVQELARLRKKHSPTDAEWNAVQTAANRIHDFLESKAGEFQSGKRKFHGATAWEILEEATGNDHLRFHQLSAMATIQHDVWYGARSGELTGPGRRLSPDLVRRVRQMHKNKAGPTKIASRLGVSYTAVQKILAGETHKESEAA